MRFLIRSFFKLVRLIMGPFMLAYEWFATPRKGVERPAHVQAALDKRCQSLTLYQFRTCPFCIKVRIAMARLALNIDKRDAQHEGPDREALIAGGGEAKVPCLRIEQADGKVQWMYESDAIIEYLEGLAAGSDNPVAA